MFPRLRSRMIALLAAGCATGALAQEPQWRISEASGQVSVGRTGMQKVATRGMGVSAGDTVTTGKGSRAVLVRGAEYMMVAPGSQLRLPPAQEQATGVTRIIEDFGNVVFVIKKKLTPHFEVKTPYLAAVVKGTTFAVGVGAEGASVQVLEGAVDVATGDGGARDLLRPGSVAMVGSNNLYRMTVETGGARRTIDSPAAPTEDAPAAAPVAVVAEILQVLLRNDIRFGQNDAVTLAPLQELAEGPQHVELLLRLFHVGALFGNHEGHCIHSEA